MLALHGLLRRFGYPVLAAYRGECPDLIEQEGHRSDDRDRNQLRPVEASSEAGGVVEDGRREREDRIRMHQKRKNAEPNDLSEDAHSQERKVLAEPAGMLRTAKRPESVELEVPEVGDQEGDRRIDVVPADIEVSKGQVQEDAILVWT